MGFVYVFAQDTVDFDNMGLCGALVPSRCDHEEMAGGMSEIQLDHPLDDMGRYKFLQPGMILKAPVPVRTTPNIVGTKATTQVFKTKVLATATKDQRGLFTKNSSDAKGDKRTTTLPEKNEVTIVSNPSGVPRYKIKAKVKVKSKWKTYSGWILKEAVDSAFLTVNLPDNTNGIEEAEPAWGERDQLFRIYQTSRTDTGITAKAMHIFYDLLGNLADYKKDGALTAQTALNSILSTCKADHYFDAYTDSDAELIGVDWQRQNPIKALLDPEEGFAARWNLEIVRDDYEIYFLKQAGLNRGVTIAYAKNLKGVTCEVDWSNVVTSVLPHGQSKDGKVIYLGTSDGSPSKTILPQSYVNSPHIDDYPVPRILPLDVAEASVEKDKSGVTNTIASRRMREAAQEIFDNGGDLPRGHLQIDFVRLADTDEYADFEALEDVFLYDTVRIIHQPLGIEMLSNVIRVVYDCLTGHYKEIELGSMQDLIGMSKIPSWQMPMLNGGNIIPGTISGAQLGTGVISADIIQANVIGARHINVQDLYATNIVAAVANIVEAIIQRADIGEAHIDYADIQDLRATVANIATAQINTANIINADITWAEIASLTAGIALIANTEIKQAKIGYAQIHDLVADSAIITEGVGGKLYINRLAVTEANIVSLAVGELMVKGPDGLFYRLIAGPDGGVTTEVVTVEGDNIGEDTIPGGALIENSITARELNVEKIFADQALVRAIKAANIDVADLFASTATIGIITADRLASDVGATLDISSNEGIRIAVNNAVANAAQDIVGRQLSLTFGRGTYLDDGNTASYVSARVYSNGSNVTHLLPDEVFVWERVSNDTASDAAWNAAHDGMKGFLLTTEDIDFTAVIRCHIDAARMFARFMVDDGDLYHIESSVDVGDDFYLSGDDLYSTSFDYYLDDGVIYVKGRDYTADPTEATVVDRTDDPYIEQLIAEITIAQGQIALKANQSSLDTLTNRVSSAESTLTILPGQIALKASQSSMDTLTGRVSSAESTLALLPGQISLKASQSSVDNLGNRVAAAELAITPNEITARVQTALVTNNRSIISSTMTFNKDGLTVAQSSFGTTFRATSTQFGLYNSSGTVLAGAGIEGGTRYFAANRIRSNDGNVVLDISNASVDGAAMPAIRGRLNGTERFFITSGVVPNLFEGIDSFMITGNNGPVRLATRLNAKYESEFDTPASGSGGFCDVVLDYGRNPITANIHMRAFYYYSSSKTSREQYMSIDAIEQRIFASRALTVESDGRLKENINDIEVNFIDYLRPRQFTWKVDRERHKLNYGFIAQEVLATVQELGLPSLELLDIDEEARLYLEPTQLISQLVDKVQKQQCQIDEMTARIERLEALIIQ